MSKLDFIAPFKDAGYHDVSTVERKSTGTIDIMIDDPEQLTVSDEDPRFLAEQVAHDAGIAFDKLERFNQALFLRDARNAQVAEDPEPETEADPNAGGPVEADGSKGP